MKEIVVLSGKGGTGKTSLTASFAALERRVAIADCDVDAADLHLLLEPVVEERHRFIAGKRARIKSGACVACGKCAELCAFDAISFDGPGNGIVPRTYRLDETRCEGCGLCVHYCPTKAIAFDEHVSGQWFLSRTRLGMMAHAQLGVAEGNSGKLSTAVRQRAREIEADILLVDGPPGVGCPVIACLTGASLACLVVEPTAAALHDLKRVHELAQHFAIPSVVVINKSDLHPPTADVICAWAAGVGVEIAGRIEYDAVVTEAQRARKSVVEFSDGAISQQIRTVWTKVKQHQ